MSTSTLSKNWLGSGVIQLSSDDDGQTIVWDTCGVTVKNQPTYSCNQEKLIDLCGKSSAGGDTSSSNKEADYPSTPTSTIHTGTSYKTDASHHANVLEDYTHFSNGSTTTSSTWGKVSKVHHANMVVISAAPEDPDTSPPATHTYDTVSGEEVFVHTVGSNDSNQDDVTDTKPENADARQHHFTSRTNRPQT